MTTDSKSQVGDCRLEEFRAWHKSTHRSSQRDPSYCIETSSGDVIAEFTEEHDRDSFFGFFAPNGNGELYRSAPALLKEAVRLLSDGISTSNTSLLELEQGESDAKAFIAQCDAIFNAKAGA